jgi:hypothetical protein
MLTFGVVRGLFPFNFLQFLLLWIPWTISHLLLLLQIKRMAFYRYQIWVDPQLIMNTWYSKTPCLKFFCQSTNNG